MNSFIAGPKSLPIRNRRQSNARSPRMEKAAGIRNLDTRPDKRTETEDHSENRLGKPVSSKNFYSNLNMLFKTIMILLSKSFIKFRQSIN